jgi:iron complex outermembrane receptor protein
MGLAFLAAMAWEGRMKPSLFAWGLVLSLPLASLLASQEQDPKQQPKRDLTELSIEELMQIEVTTVSRKGESLLDAPAAVTVIRGEDLRRTGARSIVEALRMVPGAHVGHIDGNKWAVGIRGFSERFNHRLQVMMDGRSVYSPLFSGVDWGTFDTMLEDIDRIEVIRGPGGSVWGANAMTGVVNVITKKSKDTTGGLAVAGAGSEERDFAAARWGGSAGDGLHYRAFAKYFNRDEQEDGQDDWFQARGGFRLDYAPGADTFTFQAEAYDGESRGILTFVEPTAPFVRTVNDSIRTTGGYARARWERKLSPTSELSLQMDAIHTEYDNAVFGEVRDTLELDFTHRSRLLDGHDVVWGAGYRWSNDRIDTSPSIGFDPDQEANGAVHAFVQDEITLVQDHLRLILGSKFEYFDEVGYDYQPTARLAWRPHERHAVWAAVSRAVRMPSRAEDDVRINRAVIPGVPPTLVAVFGDAGFGPERAMAYELGYRTRPADALSFDLALFYNEYKDLRAVEPGAPFLEGTNVVAPLVADNAMEGATYGFELAATWKPIEHLRLVGSTSFLRMKLDLEDGSSSPSDPDDGEGRSPRSMATLRASIDLPENLELDVIARYVDVLPNLDVDSYVEMDVRIGWRPFANLELSLVGQNLLHDEHFESADDQIQVTPTEVERGFYFSATLRF